MVTPASLQTTCSEAVNLLRVQSKLEAVDLQSKAEKDKEVNSQLSGLHVPSGPKNQTLRVKLHDDDVFI